MASLNTRLLATAAWPALLLASPLAAQTNSAAAPPTTQLDSVSVTATRSAQPLEDTPSTVSVIDDEQLNRQGATNIRDAVRYEPGVTVGNQANRGGLTNYTIRGIGENRVRVQIDGVKLPDFPGSNIGPGTYTRDFVDLETMKRIEILRGPSSALYGSDAIGGVVAYVSKDPADYLAQVGKNWYVSGKTSYDSSDNSRGFAATAAARTGDLDTLLVLSRRDGGEMNPKGHADLNPTQYESTSLLGKFVWNAGPSDRVRFTTEYLTKQSRFNLYTDRSATVLDSRGTDDTSRLRFAIDHVHDAPFLWIDRMETRLYYTRVNRDEATAQQRLTTNQLRRRDSLLQYEQEVFGGEAQFTTNTQVAGLPNKLTYGLSLDRTTTTRPRDRTEVNLVTGAVTKSFAGAPGTPAEVFPNKNFPDTETIQGGAYLQNEILVGSVLLTPALRADYYDLKPTPDQAFRNTNTQNFQVRGLNTVALSPKFGAVWKLDPRYSPFAQYAHGFRAPPYDDANIGFTNGPQGYEIIPNPNLNPETSDGVEVGLRGKFGRIASYSLSGFYNSYRNFIASQQVGVRNGLLQYQSRNLSRATIYGAEAKADWKFDPQWTLFGSFAYAEGRDESTKRPIDSVAPFTLVSGVRWEEAEGRFGGQLTVTQVLKHNAVNDPAAFRAPGYGLLDVSGYYELTPTLTINAGIENLLDARYFQFQDVSGLAANRTDLGRYAQSGRSFFVNATARF